MTAPAEQLRAAAAKLRDTAAKATPGPWSRYGNLGYVVFSEAIDVDAPDGASDVTMGSLREDDAEWIALMSPAVAEPIAAWLEEASLEYERTLRDHGPDAATYAVYHAMPVALAILGEEP